MIQKMSSDPKKGIGNNMPTITKVGQDCGEEKLSNCKNRQSFQ